MNNKSEDIKFQIDQLRKDKLIYPLESIALTLIVLLTVITFGLLRIGNLKWLLILGFAASFIYWIYVVIGNFQRFSKIKKLEKKIQK